jgi:uncharacterized protein
MSDEVEFPCNTTLVVAGPVGSLEAYTTCPQLGGAKASAVICHPHPLHGGTMHNKVVHTLARSLTEIGLKTVRFNFRGVGASAGAYGEGRGETDDVLAVLDWVRARRPGDQLWLAGFSFGAYVALRAAARFPVAQMVLVAPPVHLHAELGIPPTPRAPLLVLQGEEDEVVSPAAVKDWLDTLQPRPAVRLFPGVGHFFHGRLNDLRLAVQDALRAKVPTD